VAAELGIARSTAHRLLSMLVYRDFAVHSEGRAYLPGAALSAQPLHGEPMQRLRRTMRPHMEALCERVSETVSLMVRIGTQTRFLHSVESAQLLRVGDRQGTVLPAWKTSGGKALLAELNDEQLGRLFQAKNGGGILPEVTYSQWRTLITEVRSVRKKGFAENVEGTESGVCAVGMCVRTSGGEAIAALSVSAPSVRYTPERAGMFVHELTATVRRAAAEAL
jgi:DNA-binding IclR family transcriptional regulator